MSLSSLVNLPSQGGFMSRVAGVAPPPASPPSGAEAGASPGPQASTPSAAGQERHQPRHDVGGKLRRYVCDHNSAPPAHQYITTDKTNILIRALTLKRSKDELAGRASSAGAGPSGAASAASAAAAAAAGGPGAAARGASAAAGRPKGPAAAGSFGGGGGPSGRSSGGGAATDNDAKGKRVASSSAPEGGGGSGRHQLGQHQASGLERAAKRPALDLGGSGAGGAHSRSHSHSHSRLESLSVEQLRELLRSKGQTVGVENAGKAALLARARLSLGDGAAGQ